MIILSGIVYCLYFIILGYGVRVAYNLITHKQLIIARKTDFFAHAFFQGVFIHVVLFNLLQYIELSNKQLLFTTIGYTSLCLILALKHAINKGFEGSSVQLKAKSLVLNTAVILASLFIYWNGSLLPNIAWDSWVVWESKAEQWLYHGLSIDINQWTNWIQTPDSLFNLSAHYPDALSLIYFLPKIFTSNSNGVVHITYLFAFAMITLLLISRLAKIGAPFYLQLFFIVIIYTTPLISNHLMIHGYADIWVAMYVLLIMLTLMDYNDEQNLGLGLTLVCYLSMLPMTKLEGWVWLLLFIISHLIVTAFNHRHKNLIFIAAICFVLLLIILGGIDISTPLGNLTINQQRITLFNLIDTPVQFVNISNELMTGFFWQNNWSLVWLGLPFLLISFIREPHSKASQLTHVFIFLALLCFLFLFYFTEASKWAQDMTALNRVVLQLTPCYLFLLFKMITQMGITQNDNHIN